MHGLFRVDDERCMGVAWWIPPTKGAAAATHPDPDRWREVPALSRLAIEPEAPRNAASFLLSRSRQLIDREAWPVLVTYADQWRGHTGAIYRADKARAGLYEKRSDARAQGGWPNANAC